MFILTGLEISSLRSLLVVPYFLFFVLECLFTNVKIAFKEKFIHTYITIITPGKYIRDIFPAREPSKIARGRSPRDIFDGSRARENIENIFDRCEQYL